MHGEVKPGTYIGSFALRPDRKTRILGAVLTAIATWPTKRDAYKALAQLSDTQLADIGLARGEISRVFEPGFALQAANDGVLPAGRAA